MTLCEAVTAYRNLRVGLRWFVHRAIFFAIDVPAASFSMKQMFTIRRRACPVAVLPQRACGTLLIDKVHLTDRPTDRWPAWRYGYCRSRNTDRKLKIDRISGARVGSGGHPRIAIVDATNLIRAR